MRATELIRVLKSLIPTGRPVYIWGPPGVGKSSVVRQATAELDREFLDLRLPLLDPVDLRGLPRIAPKGKLAQWCPPAFLPQSGTGVLLLDELAQAAPLMQAAAMQLTLDRRVGEYELPPGWTVIAASNRQEDRAAAQRLITPLLNRFIHLDLQVSVEDWQEWAIQKGIVPEVRSFLRYRPGKLFDFDPNSGERAFATPRSWEFVSQVLPVLPAESVRAVLAGCVGEGTAAEMFVHMKLYRELPEIDQVLAQASTHPLPNEPAVLFALTEALIERVRGDAKGKDLAAIAQVLRRLQPEFGVLGLKESARLRPQMMQLPVVQEMMRANRGLMVA